jgi:Phage T7 tail fibre protein
MARSQTFHDTDGSTVDWDISFEGGYLSRDHVHAYFYPTANLEDERQEVAFTWVTSTRVRISPALANAGKLVLARKTPTSDSLVQFTNTADLTKENLLTVARQGVFVAAELLDVYEDPNLLGALADAKAAAAQSLVNAQAALTQAQAALGYAQTADAAQQAAETAVSTAEAAQAAAELARDEAEAALAAMPDLSQYGRKDQSNTWGGTQTFTNRTVIAQAGALGTAPVRKDELGAQCLTPATALYDIGPGAAEGALFESVVAGPNSGPTTQINLSFYGEATSSTGGINIRLGTSVANLRQHGLSWTNNTPSQYAAASVVSNSVSLILFSGVAGRWSGRLTVRQVASAPPRAYEGTLDTLSPTGVRFTSAFYFEDGADTLGAVIRNSASTGALTLRVSRLST